MHKHSDAEAHMLCCAAEVLFLQLNGLGLYSSCQYFDSLKQVAATVAVLTEALYLYLFMFVLAVLDNSVF